MLQVVISYGLKLKLPIKLQSMYRTYSTYIVVGIYVWSLVSLWSHHQTLDGGVGSFLRCCSLQLWLLFHSSTWHRHRAYLLSWSCKFYRPPRLSVFLPSLDSESNSRTDTEGNTILPGGPITFVVVCVNLAGIYISREGYFRSACTKAGLPRTNLEKQPFHHCDQIIPEVTWVWERHINSIEVLVTQTGQGVHDIWQSTNTHSSATVSHRSTEEINWDKHTHSSDIS